MDIKLFCVDCDGTLTDGKYHITEDGKVSKSFFTRDFYALGELAKKGIQVFVATSSKAGIINKKAMRLPYILNIIAGVSDKKKAIDDFLAVWGATWDNVAYIGDAENDMECMKLAGLTCCPHDAIPKIQGVADFTSKYDGGNGAVWEFANYVLKLKNNKEDECDKSNGIITFPDPA